MDKAMSIREAFNQGYDHGWSLASWNAQEIQFGMELSRSIDWVGIGTVDSVESWLEAFDCVISYADESARCYSPFEFIAHAINLRDESFGECSSEDGWGAFERGMRKGSTDYRKRYYPIRELKRDLKEWQEESD